MNYKMMWGSKLFTQMNMKEPASGDRLSCIHDKVPKVHREEVGK
jgi:hypothetical protein